MASVNSHACPLTVPAWHSVAFREHTSIPDHDPGFSWREFILSSESVCLSLCAVGSRRREKGQKNRAQVTVCGESDYRCKRASAGALLPSVCRAPSDEACF